MREKMYWNEGTGHLLLKSEDDNNNNNNKRQEERRKKTLKTEFIIVSNIWLCVRACVWWVVCSIDRTYIRGSVVLIAVLVLQ